MDEQLSAAEEAQVRRAAAQNGSDPLAEPGCSECEDWHERLIDEARMLQAVGLGLTVAVLALAAFIYLRSR